MRTIHPMMSPISRLNFVLEAKKGNNGKKRKNGSKSKSTAALKEVLLSDKDSDVTTLKQERLDDISKMTVHQLASLCKEHGIVMSVSGVSESNMAIVDKIKAFFPSEQLEVQEAVLQEPEQVLQQQQEELEQEIVLEQVQLPEEPQQEEVLSENFAQHTEEEEVEVQEAGVEVEVKETIIYASEQEVTKPVVNIDQPKEDPAMIAYREREERYNRQILALNKAVSRASPVEWRDKMKTNIVDQSSRSDITEPIPDQVLEKRYLQEERQISDPSLLAYREREEKYMKKSLGLEKPTSRVSPADWRNKMKSNGSEESTNEDTIEGFRLREMQKVERLKALTKVEKKASPVDWRNKMKTTGSMEPSNEIIEEETADTIEGFRLREMQKVESLKALTKVEKKASPVDWRNKMKSNIPEEPPVEISNEDNLEGFRLREMQKVQSLKALTKVKRKASPVDWRNKMKSNVPSQPVPVDDSSVVEGFRMREMKKVEPMLKLNKSVERASPVEWKYRMKSS
jgi:hypothetical protein